MSHNFILLDAAPADTGGGFNGIFMIIAIIAIFYFMMVRPQQKKQKEIRRFREGLEEGDMVITAGGIHGKITGIKDNHFIVRIANGVEIKVDKGSIYPYTPGPAQTGEKKDDDRKRKKEIAETKEDDSDRKQSTGLSK